MTLSLTMECKCRRCPVCLKKRAYHWRMRALNEYHAAPRTWLGTLTIEPEHRYRLTAQADQKARKRGVKWQELTEEQQFARKVREGGRDCTLFLKRLREMAKAPFRYLLVAEAHPTSGEPHFHMLVHEVDIDRPLRHKQLKRCWQIGFSDWKLVTDPDQATYPCKYIAKDVRGRVRPSNDYGKNVLSNIVGCDNTRNVLKTTPQSFLDLGAKRQP